MNTSPLCIAYFISPHGFGHAARASAVMEALTKKNSLIHFDIFTTIPRWFFQGSLKSNFNYYPILTDIGLVQKTPFYSDLDETILKLNAFYPFSPKTIADVINQLKRNRCTLVVCDISPLGIEAAKQAEIPSVLIENFTWDWIYQEYSNTHPRINTHIQYLNTIFQDADFHIQTEPICERRNVDLVVSPVSRELKNSKSYIRDNLGINPDSKMILITTGGIKEKFTFLDKVKTIQNAYFVIPGGGDEFMRDQNLILLPHHSEFFHPDLVNASDAVIGKAGYSTIAEVYHAEIPFGYIARPDFRESDKLTAFIRQEMTGFAIADSEFQDGSWVSRIEELLSLPHIPKKEQDGADLIADFLAKLIYS